MDQFQQPCPAPPLDQDGFERVWRRVMPEPRSDCPFSLNPQVPQPRQEPAPVCSACLGQASQGDAPELERFVRESTRASRGYRRMAQQAGTTGGRALGGIAADKARQAKRLGAAYFLITGQSAALPPEPVQRPSPLPLALRQRFQAEQTLACAYRAAAEQTQDSCLKELYKELAEECDTHAQVIRSVLERL